MCEGWIWAEQIRVATCNSIQFNSLFQFTQSNTICMRSSLSFSSRKRLRKQTARHESTLQCSLSGSTYVGLTKCREEVVASMIVAQLRIGGTHYSRRPCRINNLSIMYIRSSQHSTIEIYIYYNIDLYKQSCVQSWKRQLVWHWVWEGNCLSNWGLRKLCQCSEWGRAVVNNTLYAMNFYATKHWTCKQ